MKQYNAEQELRLDERQATLSLVEKALFDHCVGPSTTLDEDSDDITRRRVSLGLIRFIRLSDYFRVLFKDDWPNR